MGFMDFVVRMRSTKCPRYELCDRGLIVNAVSPTTIRLVPPITVTDSEIDEAVAMISAALEVASEEGTE